MPLLFDDILVNSSGIVSVCDITLPANGRRVRFIINNPYGYNEIPSVDIYLRYEGRTVGPLVNGDAVETSVLPIIGKILQMPYDAKAIVVSTGYYSANSESSILLDYGIKSSLNVITTAHIVMSYESSFHIKDSKELVEEYIKGSFSPLTTVTSYINSFLKNSGNYIINSLGNNDNDGLLVNSLPSISENLSKRCIASFNNTCKWGEIISLDVNLAITNVDEILDELNRQAKIKIDIDTKTAEATLEERRLMTQAKIEIQKMITQGEIDFRKDLLLAIRESFTQSVIPDELTPILVSYFQSNPGVSYDQMLGIMTQLNNLTQKATPLQILKNAEKLGLVKTTGLLESK